MNELDMSRPGAELFPEATPMQYNSYTDQSVGDPLDTGVTRQDVAGPANDKELNFAALRDEVAKFKQESEYWRGRAEAHSVPVTQAEPAKKSNPYEGIDWDDGDGVRQAFTHLRQENEALRREMLDSMAAVQTKAQHSDWNNMVTQHVPQLTSKNPMFAEMIQNASNPYEAAYLLAELQSRGSQPQPQPVPQQHNYAQRAMSNAQKPQSVASVGGNGTLSAADYYANMSDEDFMKVAAKNLANI